MAFVQQKLTLVAQQSVGSLNLYVYEPDNGDTSTDVLGAGYFSESRFIGDDGWVDSFLFCNLDDGPFIMQIQANGITAAQVGAGGGDIPAIVNEIDSLDVSVRGLAVVDMDDDDYTLTDAEASAELIAVLNTGDGTKTLTFPTTSDLLRPRSQIVTSLFSGGGAFTLASESGGASIVIAKSSTNIVSFVTGSTEIDVSGFIKTDARKVTNGNDTTDTINNSFTGGDMGKVIIANSTAGAQVWTLESTADAGWLNDATFTVVVPAGADGITITGEAGVTLNPASVVIAASSSRTFVKINSSDTWYAY